MRDLALTILAWEAVVAVALFLIGTAMNGRK